MTKHIYRTLRALALLLAVAATAGCMDNFAEYNRNPNETTDAELERDNYLIGSYLEAMMDQVVPTEEHLYQFVEALACQPYGRYTAPTSSGWVQSFPRFNPPVNWVKALYNDPLTKLYPNYRGILKRSKNPVILAIADVVRVAVMHPLTDRFGPIPYSKWRAKRRN